MKRSLKNFGEVQAKLSNYTMKNIKGGFVIYNGETGDLNDLSKGAGGSTSGRPMWDTGVRIDVDDELHGGG